MAEASAHTWWRQANSDLRASHRVLDADDPTTYCQAIAKHQQAVEKSVKALAAAARDANIASIRIKHTHGLDKLINALRRLHPNANVGDIQWRIDRIIGGNWETEIATLMQLAPRAPEQPGDAHPRNTEYPFNADDGSWVAPSDASSFSSNDVQRSKAVAEHLVFESERFISALRRIG